MQGMRASGMLTRPATAKDKKDALGRERERMAKARASLGEQLPVLRNYKPADPARATQLAKILALFPSEQATTKNAFDAIAGQ
jgi:hypothetical protein